METNLNQNTDRVTNGNRWNLFRRLYNMEWTSCLIGLVIGCVVTVYMTISLMLIIIPYLQTHNSETCLWSDYSIWQWEACSVTCGHGLQQGQRSRKCPSNCACMGNDTELMTRHCVSSHCTVDGGWGEWNQDTPCSKTCGNGTKNVYRNCNNPRPENGGNDCVGLRITHMECNLRNCCPDDNVQTNLIRCEGGWARNDDVGACYCFSTRKATWYEAKSTCNNRKAELANMYSLSESTWVMEHCKRRIAGAAWIGGKRVNYKYKWIFKDGTGEMNFTHWAPNEPVLYSSNGYTCVQLWAGRGGYLWDDYDCYFSQGFICKQNL